MIWTDRSTHARLQTIPSLDCDSNGRLDTCQMLDDPSHDCDFDGMLDSCQVASDPGLYDCDADGVLDGCTIAQDPAADCDGNGQLDMCDIEADPSFDCNGDGSLDSCLIVDDPSFYDCDSNGQLDSCEMEADPTGLDCDSDGHLDSCAIASDPAVDCDADGMLDSCQVVSDPGLYDCDADAVLDSCQIANDPALYDCDSNGVLDSCEIAADPAVVDCNGDGMLDACTIAVNPAADCDGNGILDECESPSFALPAYWMTERFVNGIDLSGGGARLVPTGNAIPPFWQLCTVNAGDVWIVPSSHTSIHMIDDDSVQHTLPFPFTYAGQTWNDVYIGSAEIDSEHTCHCGGTLEPVGVQRTNVYPRSKSPAKCSTPHKGSPIGDDSHESGTPFSLQSPPTVAWATQSNASERSVEWNSGGTPPPSDRPAIAEVAVKKGNSLL